MLPMLGPECEALADGPQRRGGWGCMDPACFQHGYGQRQQKEEFLSFW